jgi:hypothetical protein
MKLSEIIIEGWSEKYKRSIDCSHPKGFSQKAHCAGKKKHNESIEMEMTCPDCGMCQTHGDHSHDNLEEACWKGYHKEGNKKMFGKTYPNCVKNTNEEQEEKCPHCNGPMFSEMIMNEKKDACYYKVKSRYKVWPSAYASGALVKCRKAGASNWGNKSESVEESIEELDENLHQWFKEKWVRFGPDGKIRGDCARGDDSEGKPKCLPQSKAHNLGKKGRASAAARKRREDPNPERSGQAINVATKKKQNENLDQGVAEVTKKSAIKQYTDIQNYKPNFKTKPKSDTEEFLKITVTNPKKQGVSEDSEKQVSSMLSALEKLSGHGVPGEGWHREKLGAYDEAYTYNDNEGGHYTPEVTVGRKGNMYRVEYSGEIGMKHEVFNSLQDAINFVCEVTGLEQGMAEGENWSKYNHKRVGGMSSKSVKSYRRSHPGSKIQTAVTTKPSKLKKGSKSAKRRASFCARMRGMKKHRTSAKTARDPNSNINKSLRRWHCESIEEMQQLVMIAEQKIYEAKNLAQQAAIAINMKKKHKKPNLEGKGDYIPPKEADYGDDYQAMVKRVGQKAKQQELAKKKQEEKPKELDESTNQLNNIIKLSGLKK